MPIRTDRAVAHGVEQRFAVALIGLVMRYFQTGAIGQTRAARLLGDDPPSDGGTRDSVGLSCRLFKFTLCCRYSWQPDRIY